MKISIIGTGYVGLITGTCLAELGNKVTCVDVIEGKVRGINSGKAPIFEEGLDELLAKNIGNNLKASLDLESAVLGSEITFICVGTPDSENGEIDLKYVKNAAESIGKALSKKKGYHVVVTKSTVVPGTTDSVVLPILEKSSSKNAGEDFGVCMNPEFLREGMAISDFMKPDRIIIGAMDEKASNILEKVYASYECPKLKTDLRTAEMIKYASNVFLATKISFINEIANICERVGSDVVDVAKGIGLDSRISPAFLNAGIGWGGSCLPKDVKALREISKKNNYDPKMLDAVIEINRGQAERVLGILNEKIGNLKEKKVAVVGLAFKPGTDDMREAPSLTIISRLLEEGAIVSACDPISLENARKILGESIKYSKDVESCIEGVDVIVFVTEWEEYKKPAGFFKDKMNGSVFVDGRRVLDPKEAKSVGLDYFGIGHGK